MDRNAILRATAWSKLIKQEAHRLGFELVGIASVQRPPHEASLAQWLRDGFAGEMEYMKRTETLRRDPRQLVPWAVSVVSVGMNYYAPLPRLRSGTKMRGWISRYAWGADYHGIVKQRLEELLNRVREISGRRVEGKAFVDSGPVLERDIAGFAGIGWIGKNTHLISPRKGSWFFLGELFLSLELAYDRPIRDRCGQCNLCLTACPTRAFVAPYVLDARRCISYLTIELKGFIPRPLRPLIGGHVFGCDICQEICPYNVKASPGTEQCYAPRQGLYAPELIPFLSISEEGFRRHFRDSPLLRAKRRGFLRNVAVALGNVGGAQAVGALIPCLDDAEPLVRGHAAWALGRIASPAATHALQKKFVAEPDAEVRREIEQAIQDARTRR